MKKTKTKTDAACRVIEGDSLIALRELPDASVDAVITDPPYSSGGTFGRDRAKADANDKYQNPETRKRYPALLGDGRDGRSFLAWCSLWLAECWRVAKDGAVIAVFSDWRQLPTMSDALQAGGWLWRGIIPWDKTTGRPFPGRPRQQAEYILWGSRGAMPTERGVGFLPGAHRIALPTSEKQHVNAKPVALMRELVKLAPPGALVLDPFMGSGSTGVGALLEGRRFLGIELNSVYAEIARARLAAARCNEPN